MSAAPRPSPARSKLLFSWNAVQPNLSALKPRPRGQGWLVGAVMTARAVSDLGLAPGVDCYAILQATTVARGSIGQR